MSLDPRNHVSTTQTNKCGANAVEARERMFNFGRFYSNPSDRQLCVYSAKKVDRSIDATDDEIAGRVRRDTVATFDE